MSPPIPNSTAQGSNRILDIQRAKKFVNVPYLQGTLILYKIPLFEQPKVGIIYLILKSFPKMYAELLHVAILKNTR